MSDLNTGRHIENDLAAARWKANGGTGKFVAILDCDDVASGDDFLKVCLDGSDLASQRGEDACLTIYDVGSGQEVPR
jgi:hypothetical protein